LFFYLQGHVTVSDLHVTSGMPLHARDTVILEGSMTQQKADDQTPDWLQAADPLAEALRIDDARSDYCQQLETRIAELSAEVEVLRGLLQQKERSKPNSD